MTKARKGVLSALAAIMAFSLTGALFLGFSPDPRTVNAARSTTAWTEIGEIYNDDNHHFDAGELLKLYQALGGNETKTIYSLRNKVQTSGPLTSADFREVNDGNNISVWLGGMKWDAVYLTRATSSRGNVSTNDLILDLWRSSDNLDTSGSSFSSTTTSPDRVPYNNWWDNPAPLDTYPSNMYSTSTIRVQTLNAGGKYSNDGGDSVTSFSQDRNNQYARFTMDGNDSNGKDSLKKYIARPYDIKYQETEFDAATALAYSNTLAAAYQGQQWYLPNDAYGIPATGGQWGNDTTTSRGERIFDYLTYTDSARESGAKYDSWQDDYLWLPSLTETGLEDGDGNGLWDTDTSLRSMGASGVNRSWLRSGPPINAMYALTMYVDGKPNSQLSVDLKHLARPAMHFNLSAAARAAAVGEIYKGDGEFDVDNMNTLYDLLANSASFSAVEAAAKKNTTSAVFRDYISVFFGGIKWYATYLTTAQNTTENTKAGNVILDLWRTPDTLTDEKDKWTFSGGWTAAETSNAYPSNMYSTSKVRVEALNAGGQYSTDGSTLTTHNQDPSNQYARFTMSTVSDSLTKWLATPSEVGYQENEYDKALDSSLDSYEKGHYFPNDAYGTPMEGGTWSTESQDMTVYSSKGSGATAYDAWKDDYLWLPSATETGSALAKNGIWRTDSSLRKDTGTRGRDFWLRSGYYYHAGDAYTIDGGGSDLQNWDTNDSNYVRPALHLNLTKINDTLTETLDAEWKNETFYTSGEDLFETIRGSIWAADFTMGGAEVRLEAEVDYTVYWKDDPTHAKEIIDAGEYTFVIELLNPRYQFAGGIKTKELTVTVVEAVARVKYSYGDSHEVVGFESFNAAWNFSWSIPYKASTIILNQADPDAQHILVRNATYTSQDLTIDLNGHHLRFQSGDGISFTEGSTLILTDSSGKDTGKFSGVVNVDNGGVFTMKGGTLNGRVEVSDSGSFIMENGSINGRVKISEYGDGGSFTMEKGSIIGSGNYAGVYVYSGGNFTMKGGSVTSTDSDVSGVHVYGGGSLTMSGGSVKGDPGVRVKSNGSFTWSGGDIDEVGLEGNSDNTSSPYINVSSTFTNPSNAIAIELDDVNYYDKDIPVLQWEGDDPTECFKSKYDDICYYAQVSEKKIYMGLHSLVWNGEADWSDFTSLTFKGIRCEHCVGRNQDITATLRDNNLEDTIGITSEITVEQTCTQNGTREYTAKGGLEYVGNPGERVNLEFEFEGADFFIGVPSAKLKNENLTATTTETLAATGHAWEYSAIGAELTATCSHTHADVAKEGPQAFTITVVAPTVSTYTGTDHAATVSGDTGAEPFVGYTLTYGFSKTDLSYTDMGPELPKAAGNYEARIAAKGSSVKATVAFVIEKATLTVTANPYTIVYGEPQSVWENSGAEITGFQNGEQQADAVRGEPSFTYDYTWLDPVNGDYHITPTLGTLSADNYDFTFISAKLTIARAMTTVVWSGSVVDFTYTYGSVTQPYAWIQSGNFDEENLTVSIQEKDGKEFKNADSYTYIATLGGSASDNYQIVGGQETQSYLIRKKPVAAPSSFAGTVYSGEEQTVAIDGTLEYALSDKGKGTDAGRYDVVLSLKDKNYKWADLDGDNESAPRTFESAFEIEQATIAAALSWTDAENHIYDGVSHFPQATVKGVGSTTLSLDVRMLSPTEGVAVYKNAGSYTFTAALNERDERNYDFDGSVTLTVDVTVGVKDVAALSWTDGPYTYTGAVIATGLPEATFAGEGDDKTVTLRVIQETAGEFKNHGDYTFRAELRGIDATNYHLTGPTKTFTIGRADLTVTWDGPHSYVYGTAVFPTPHADFKGNDAETTNLIVTEMGGREFQNVGEYSFTVSLEGDAADNYSILKGGQQLYTVTRATLVVRLSATVEYGEEVSGDNVTLSLESGLVSWDDENALLTAAKSAAKFDFGGYQTGTTGVAQSGSLSVTSVNGTLANYTVEYESCRLTVTRRRIILTLHGAFSNTYGDKEHGTITATAAHDGAGEWFGRAADEDALNGQLAYTFRRVGEGISKGYTSDMGGGNYLIYVAWTEDSTLSVDYEIVNGETGTEYTVRKTLLTVTARDHEITYGDAPSNEGVTYSGFVNGEGPGVLGGRLSFSYNYVQYGDIGENYKFTPRGYTSDNYDFRYVTGTLRVRARSVTVEITLPDLLSFSDIGEFTYHILGLVHGDAVTAVLSFKGTQTDGTAYEGSERPTAAGSYTVWAAALDGSRAGNYTIAANGERSFSIGRAAVREPDRDARTFTYNGLMQEYSVAENTLYTVVGNRQTSAGTYFVTIALRDTDNYMWAAKGDSEVLSYEFVIKKATLSVTANPHEIIYGDAPENGGVAFDGFVGEEDEGVLTGAVEYAYSYRQFDDVGESYTIIPSGYSSDNYDIHYVDGTLKVKAKSVTATITLPDSLVYHSIGAFSVKVEGLVNSDPVTAALTFSGTANDASTLIDSPDAPILAGSYTVKAISLDGDKAGNYTLAEGEAVAFTIERAAVREPDRDARTFTYNGTAQTYSVAENDLYTVVGNRQINADSYLVTISLRDTDNYKWANGSSEVLSYEFIIERAALTITARDHEIIYGEAPANGGVEFDGFVNGEEVGVLTGAVEYAYSYRQFGDIGKNYKITPSGYSSDNYDIHYAEGTLRVRARSVTVKITLPDSLVYHNVGEFSVRVEGLVNSDPVTAVLTFSGTANDASAYLGGTGPEKAGSYTVKATALDGDKAGNYTLAGDGEESFTIARATAKEPAADTTVYIYNGREQTYTVVGGDAELFEIKGNVQRDACESGYPVTASLTDRDNYMWQTNGSTEDLTFSFIIQRASLTITARDREIVYGEAPANSGVDFMGFVNKETAQVLGGTLAYVYSYEQYGDVGENYTITPNGYTSDNYDIHYESGTLRVVPRELEVVWGAHAYTYTGEGLTPPTATAVGIGEDGEFTLTVALNDPSQTFLGAGEYLFRATLDTSAARAKNYTLMESTATHSYIVAKQTVTAPTLASRVYNGETQTAEVSPSARYTVTENSGGISVGSYTVRLTLTDSANYRWTEGDGADLILTFAITRAVYSMEGVTLPDLTLTYDGREHSLEVDGSLPSGVTVTYEGNGKMAVGNYTVTAVFEGDAQNYEAIPSIQAVLTILPVSHDLSGISFGDVTVKYDGAAHGITIDGTLPTNVTVTYEGNGQVDPDIYTVTAVFHDPDGDFDRMTAVLIILRTHTQSEPVGESGSGTEVSLISEEGFDPTLELVVEELESVSHTYWAWEKDQVSKKYAVKMCKNGVEVPFDGRVTVRLRIPQEFREKAFELMAVQRGESIEYTREGDYVVFVADGLSAYVFTTTYTPYFPVLIIATGVLLADVVILIVLAVVLKKKEIQR